MFARLLAYPLPYWLASFLFETGPEIRPFATAQRVGNIPKEAVHSHGYITCYFFHGKCCDAAPTGVQDERLGPPAPPATSPLPLGSVHSEVGRRGELPGQVVALVSRLLFWPVATSGGGGGASDTDVGGRTWATAAAAPSAGLGPAVPVCHSAPLYHFPGLPGCRQPVVTR